MPDHIHTIPVLDALREPGNCAFCTMHGKLTRDAIHFMLSPSYMEDDVRTETNRLGFCKSHLDAMYEQQNRLGLGLMLHTHLRQINKDFNSYVKNKLPAPFFGKDINSPIAKIRARLEKVNASCYICNRVEGTFTRYIDTFLYLWGKGGDDAKLIKSQKCYCLPHFLQLLSAAEGLGRGKRDKFTEEIITPQLEYMNALEGDLEWFTLKFDHRNANEPWKNSKDALPRTMSLLEKNG